MKQILYSFLIVLLMIGTAGAASTVTETARAIDSMHIVLTFEITAHTDGSIADHNIDTDTMATLEKGYHLTTVRSYPHAMTPTTDKTDFTIQDSAGNDLMCGAIADRSDTSKETTVTACGVPQLVDDDLTLTGSNNSVNSGMMTLKAIFSRY